MHERCVFFKAFWAVHPKNEGYVDGANMSILRDKHNDHRAIQSLKEGAKGLGTLVSFLMCDAM